MKIDHFFILNGEKKNFAIENSGLQGTKFSIYILYILYKQNCKLEVLQFAIIETQLR